MLKSNLELFSHVDITSLDKKGNFLIKDLESFCEFGKKTIIEQISIVGLKPIPVFTNEFWTSKQRAANSLHEISYRACFKPQLPRFFIERLTNPGDLVYDPFIGRGTTMLEGALMGRKVVGCDINPLSEFLLRPRLTLPSISQIASRLNKINFTYNYTIPKSLLEFYHPHTLEEICALKRYLSRKNRQIDNIDAWIRMVATNRLTGHSKGFFSVYTLPPNQAVTLDRQRNINKQRNQKPDYRNVSDLILKKSKSLLSKVTSEDRKNLELFGSRALILTQSSDQTQMLKRNSVSLVVTSPPFLDTVDYATDNWLRCWFNEIDEKKMQIWIFKKIEDWQTNMTLVFKELKRILKPGGYVAFEVGEVRGGKVKLEEHVVPAAESAGLEPILILINSQEFTKTSQCWGIDNLTKGTNTNRIVLLKKEK